MQLRNRCEGNSQPVGQVKEHTTQIWDILHDYGKKAIQKARKEAKG